MTYTVIVHFATSAAPRAIATFQEEEKAFRRAFEYTSDAKGVWVVVSNGTKFKVSDSGVTKEV